MINLAKRYLPFALIFAAMYLVLPIFFQGENYRYDAIEYQFLFPATALVSGLVYSWRHGVDFTFPLIAPIIYIGSVLIYSHYYHWIIYVFIYLIVGMLGCFIGDMVYKSNIEQENAGERKKNDSEPNIKISNFTVEKNDREG
ncbi:MAG: hypothetical protein J1E96_04595 [Ruminococcus sp.]|nr:hypothetical protein [Ruminococcus sp.]